MPDAAQLRRCLDEATAAAARGDYRTGIRHATEAADLAAQLPDRARQAEALTLLANQQGRLGEHEAAVTSYEQAAQLRQAIGDEAARSRVLASQSLPYSELGMYDEALRVLTTSREIADRLGDRGLLFWAHNRTGLAHTMMGEHTLADPVLKHALTLVDPSGPELFCTLNNLAFNTAGLVPQLRERGDAETAAGALELGLRYCVQAVELARSSDHPYSKAISVLNHGLLLGLAGDFDPAYASIEEGRGIAAASGYRSIELEAELNAARVQAMQGELAIAAARLERLVADPELSRYHVLLTAAHREASGAYERLRDFESALRHYQAYHRIEREANSERAAVRARLLTTHIELDNARLEAENAYLEAELQRLRSERLEADKLALEQRATELNRRIHSDDLTGLYNRRHVAKRLPEIFRAAAERGSTFCLSIVDVDRFKTVNDTFGHAVGDLVLRRLAAVLREQAARACLVARVGGEEFLLVFPDLTLSQAAASCERIRASIAAHAWHTVHPHLRVTASFGVADNHGLHNHREMLALADERLYQAKRDGRNRVEAGTVTAGTTTASTATAGTTTAGTT